MIFVKPEEIVAFETLSIWPAYFYKKINKNVNIHVHHHEYASLEELVASSSYIKFLHRKEKELFKQATFSHTNEDRKVLYLKDHANIIAAKVEVYPNLPPLSWWNDFGSKKKAWKGPKIKMVYVGALDLDTMYVKEVVEWMHDYPELFELTFISHQMNAETRSYIESKAGCQIELMEPINYANLPTELIKYDLGLILYKGHLLNHIYSVPNKVNEYLYCGLKVIGDNCLISTSKLNQPDILLFSFKDGLKSENIIEFTHRHFQFDCLNNNSLIQRYI